jgi:hypothetical protein
MGEVGVGGWVKQSPADPHQKGGDDGQRESERQDQPDDGRSVQRAIEKVVESEGQPGQADEGGDESQHTIGEAAPGQGTSQIREITPNCQVR